MDYGHRSRVSARYFALPFLLQQQYRAAHINGYWPLVLLMCVVCLFAAAVALSRNWRQKNTPTDRKC